MLLNFKQATGKPTPQQSPWASFYEEGEVSFLAEPDLIKGWVDIKDPFKDKEKAGFSLRTGLLHLWSTSSQESAVAELKAKGVDKHLRTDLPGDSGYFFTPVEFLMLRYDLPRDEAIKSVDEFLARYANSDYQDFGNKDEGFVKDVPKLQPRDLEVLRTAQEFLKTKSGELSDIVQQYCYEKGIRYETLLDFGAGVRLSVNGDKGNDQILLPYFLNRKLVGVRVRGWSYKRAFTGTMMTLFGLQQLDDLQSQTVVVVEGETDALVTHQVLVDSGFKEIPVVAIPTNTFRHEWKRLLNGFKRIIAIPQTDAASTKFAKDMQIVFGDKVEIIEIPFQQFDIGKDISHFITRSVDAYSRLFLTLGLSKGFNNEFPRIETLSSLFASKLEERPFWINEIMPKGSLVILAGPPKSGKTFIALEIALSAMNGSSLFGKEVFASQGQAKVMYIVEENSRYSLIQRFKTMGFTQDLEDKFHLMHLQNVRLDERESTDELRRDVNALKPDLVIFDPFANFHSQEENSSTGIMKVLHSITRMMKGLPDTTFIILHHTGKNSESPRIRGSSALWGRADLQLLVMPTDEDRATQIKLKVSGREINPDILDTMELVLDSETLTHRESDVAFMLPSIVLKKDRTEDKEKLYQGMKGDTGEVEWKYSDLIRLTGLSWHNISLALVQMVKEKVITLDDPGNGHPALIRLVQEITA